MAKSGPLTAASFNALVARVGPFEPRPEVAIGVSGGADSVALSLLADQWARRRQGHLIALTVDHGLRAESAAEARQVRNWLRARGITHHILRWTAPMHGHGAQAAARAARYDLLEGWCASHGVLHLLMAHQAEDQAETFLLRLARGSGARGLACMAPVVEHGQVRLLRPLLGVKRAAITDYLLRAGQEWIEDPSNQNPAYTRTILRRGLPALAELGLGSDRLVETTARLGRTRAGIEAATARWCVPAVTTHPAGFLTVDPAHLRRMPMEIESRCLAGAITTVSGSAYGPRTERLARLCQAVRDGTLKRTRTLGGCRIRPLGDKLIICRELAAIGPATALKQGGTVVWDRRFRVEIASGQRRGLRVDALGMAGLAAIKAAGHSNTGQIPAIVLPSLPTIWRMNEVHSVPHLGYRRRATPHVAATAAKVTFTPAHAWFPAEFGIA